MRQVKVIFLFFAVAILISVLFGRIAKAQVKHTIDGEVLDKENNAITGVLVKVYRGNQMIGEDRTQSDGKYKIMFDRGTLISTVRYEHSAWNPASITNISGARDHSIKKVLNSVGSMLSLSEGSELLYTVELFYRIDRASKVPVEAIRGRYEPAVEKMRIPGELEPKRKEVRALLRGVSG